MSMMHFHPLAVSRAFSALCLAMLSACATPPKSQMPQTPPPRFVELEGPSAEPYATLGRKRFERATVYMTRRDYYRIEREIHGPGYRGFDPPLIPQTTGPYVFRDTVTGRIVTDFNIGWDGYYEIAFTRDHPPKVARTYFTDHARTARFPDINALYRYTTRQRDRLHPNPASAAAGVNTPP